MSDYLVTRRERRDRDRVASLDADDRPMNMGPMHGPAQAPRDARSSRVSRRAVVAGSALFLCPLAVAIPRVAHADAAIDTATSKDLKRAQERRKGLIFGFGVGVGVAGASGYPNKSAEIGVPADYSGSDAMGGGGFAVFAMYSLSDWLSFGAFYSRANFRSGDWYTFGGGGGIRVDFFPLYYMAPWLRDLGVTGQFGIGTSTLLPTSGIGEGPSGTESFLGGGFFYEFFLGKAMGGHWVAGPTAEFDTEITQSNQRYGALFGGRVAFYTGR